MTLEIFSLSDNVTLTRQLTLNVTHTEVQNYKCPHYTTLEQAFIPAQIYHIFSHLQLVNANFPLKVDEFCNKQHQDISSA